MSTNSGKIFNAQCCEGPKRDLIFFSHGFFSHFQKTNYFFSPKKSIDKGE